MGSIYDLSYPITKKITALISINFRAFSVPDVLIRDTDIIYELKKFIVRNQGHEERDFLILVRREAKKYGSINGIEFGAVPDNQPI